MAEESFEERTEQATPRKRQKAREKGEVASSREIVGIIPVWSIVIYLFFGGAVLTAFLNYVRGGLKRSFEMSVNEVTILDIFKADSLQVGMLLLPLFAGSIVVILAVHMLQTGFLFSGARLNPEFSRINPLQGLKRYFSLNMLAETLKGVLKVLVLGAVLYYVLKGQAETLPLMVDMNMLSLQAFSFNQIYRLIMISALVITLFAVADFVYQRWQFGRNLRMSKQEMKEENKEIEGDPLVKARIRSLQREMARKRMMAEVPKADVVITNPTHFAICLKYEADGMSAPRVIAKGQNLIAQKIKEVARTSGVPMFEDKPLARALYQVQLGQEIPEMFYKAVATILAHVYKAKGKGVRK